MTRAAIEQPGRESSFFAVAVFGVWLGWFRSGGPVISSSEVETHVLWFVDSLRVRRVGGAQLRRIP